MAKQCELMFGDHDRGREGDRPVGLLGNEVAAMLRFADLAKARPAPLIQFQDRYAYHAKSLPFFLSAQLGSPLRRRRLTLLGRAGPKARAGRQSPVHIVGARLKAPAIVMSGDLALFRVGHRRARSALPLRLPKRPLLRLPHTSNILTGPRKFCGGVVQNQSVLDVRGDPLGQLAGTDLPGGDSNHRRDDFVGVLQSPSSPVDNDESPHRGIGRALVAVRQRVVLDQMLEKYRSLSLEFRVELDTAKRRLGGDQS